MLIFLPSEMARLFSFGFVQKSWGNRPVPATKSKDQPATMNDEPETSNDVDHKPSVDMSQKNGLKRNGKCTRGFDMTKVCSVCPSFLSLNIASGAAQSFIYVAAVVSGQIPSLFCAFSSK